MKFIYRENFEDIPYVQKAVQSALAIHKHPRELHTRLITLYWDYYNKLGEEIHLEFAYTHMSAFLRSGYDYRGREDLFAEVAKAVGYQSLEEFLHMIQYKVKSVKLTKNRIEKLLGSGYAYIDDERIGKDEIVKEIMQKIMEKKIGTYRYTQHYKDRFTITHLFVKESGAYLIDNKGDEYRFYDE